MHLRLINNRNKRNNICINNCIINYDIKDDDNNRYFHRYSRNIVNNNHNDNDEYYNCDHNDK